MVGGWGKFYPYKKTGVRKSFSLAEVGHKTFVGTFNIGTLKFSPY